MTPQRQLAVPAYMVAGALMFIPLMDTATQVLPMRIHDVRWRWGFFGLLTNALMIPLVGLLIAYFLTVLFEHRRFQKLLGVLSFVLVLGILTGLGVFSLDSLQAVGEMPPKQKLAATAATTTAVCKATLGIVTLLAFAWASLKAPKVSRSVKSKAGGGLIMSHGMTPKSTKTITAGDSAPSESVPG